MSTSTKDSRVWFVTGAASGFGREIASAALARGERVVATARDPKALDDLVRLAPERVLALRLDVTSASEIADATAAATKRFGRIDVLVNNAGYGLVGAVEETSDAELRGAMETMFFGAVALTRAVLPGMRERAHGTIVQITSMGGLTTAPGFGAYCAAKHALEGLSESLAAEVAPFGIRVVIVEPGAFRTRLFSAGFRPMPALDAYIGTVGPTRDFTIRTDGSQEGDPAKAAEAIVETVLGTEAPPLRLPLGDDAVDGIRTKLARIAADVDRSERVARATTFSK